MCRIYLFENPENAVLPRCLVPKHDTTNTIFLFTTFTYEYVYTRATTGTTANTIVEAIPGTFSLR